MSLWLSSIEKQALYSLIRTGISTPVEVAFQTGDFNCSILILGHLENNGAIQAAEKGFCVTGKGLESLYFAELFDRATELILKLNLINLKSFTLRQVFSESSNIVND